MHDDVDQPDSAVFGLEEVHLGERDELVAAVRHPLGGFPHPRQRPRQPSGQLTERQHGFTGPVGFPARREHGVVSREFRLGGRQRGEAFDRHHPPSVQADTPTRSPHPNT
ncbi:MULTISPECIES: hypothetical protein [unclassified Amycolatopsis]|uniref:hypothetical protein n=1 Tax=unclassified Amycolatopsis TaxID=2618356 RepID=UPI00287BA62A|nr:MULTISPECIES: hypothetical protein [unclassified Amycolatopsis]